MTSLSQKSINNSLTRSNSAEIAGFAMPSNLYEELSFISKPVGTYTYTAPANGYFSFTCVCGSSGSVVRLKRNGRDVDCINSNGFNGNVNCACKKNDVLSITITTHGLYDMGEQTFFYAEGEL